VVLYRGIGLRGRKWRKSERVDVQSENSSKALNAWVAYIIDGSLPHIDCGAEHVFQLGSCRAQLHQRLDVKTNAVVAATGNRNP
jgi:hypothetical protein